METHRLPFATVQGKKSVLLKAFLRLC
jgi:hypothetical protein